MTIDHEWLLSMSGWFIGKRNVEPAMNEILARFSEEPDPDIEWTLQDICEQSRRIIRKWDNMGK